MAEFELDEDLVKRLSQLLKDADLSEIEYEAGGQRIRVARQIHQSVSAPMPAAAPVASAHLNAAPAPSAESSEPVPAGAVTSPMVGTIYLAAEPNAPAFVQVGDSVREGQTLVIVEAMKVMNPLPAPRAGTVTRIFVSDGQPVEFGEPLLVVE